METIHNPGRRIGRNELCPCGSGKKAKHCHRGYFVNEQPQGPESGVKGVLTIKRLDAGGIIMGQEGELNWDDLHTMVSQARMLIEKGHQDHMARLQRQQIQVPGPDLQAMLGRRNGH